MTEPLTDAGKRLLWMLDDRPDVKAFDAKLVRRIVEEFVPRIEAEAAATTPIEHAALLAALVALVRACRVDGVCRLCGVPSSTMHEPDCAVDVAIGVMP